MDSWEVINSTYDFVCPWLKVRRDHVKLPSKVEINDFYIVEANDFVNIIAITEDGHILIEEQYRHGISKVCFELPAGDIKFNEDPLTAAKRELLEETGYYSNEWIAFGDYAPNTSNMNNICHSFIAKNVKKVQNQQLEETEILNVYLFSIKEIKTLLINGNIIEGVIQAPLWRYINEIK